MRGGDGERWGGVDKERSRREKEERSTGDVA